MQNRNTAFKKAKLCLGGVNFADPNYGHRSPILASDNRELIRAAVDLGVLILILHPDTGAVRVFWVKHFRKFTINL